MMTALAFNELKNALAIQKENNGRKNVPETVKFVVILFNPLQPGVAFLYPPKTSENLL